jgi:hypothetical protein
MKKTILSHFYNEEYLLPWWLNHHKEIFDDGILIDYDSTDRSVEIIKEICPSWTVVTSANRIFEPFAVDREIMDYESKIQGYKMALNTTEFLVGNHNDLNKETYVIPCIVMVDPPSENSNAPNYDCSLICQKYFGMSHQDSRFRRCRALHNHSINYTVGRHFDSPNTEDLAVLWYGWSPYTPDMLKRKLQIKNRMPVHHNGFGIQHTMGIEEMQKTHDAYSKLAIDLRPTISKYFSFSD